MELPLHMTFWGQTAPYPPGKGAYLSHKVRRCWLVPTSAILTVIRQELGDVGGEGGADLAERAVDAASKAGHASGCAESDQSNDQGVLDQILAFFAVLQVLEFDVDLKKDAVHV